MDRAIPETLFPLEFYKASASRWNQDSIRRHQESVKAIAWYGGDSGKSPIRLPTRPILKKWPSPWGRTSIWASEFAAGRHDRVISATPNRRLLGGQIKHTPKLRVASLGCGTWWNPPAVPGAYHAKARGLKAPCIARGSTYETIVRKSRTPGPSGPEPEPSGSEPACPTYWIRSGDVS